MLQLMETGYGTKKSIPQLILAGASLDDIFVIVLFSGFLGMAQGEQTHLSDFLKIPISIASGILLGIGIGMLLFLLFEGTYKKDEYIRNSMKVILILAFAFLLMAIEEWAQDSIAISGLLAVVSMAAIIRIKSLTP